MDRSPTHRALGLLAVVGLVLGWILLAPPHLGGSTSYAIVYGSSMEPRLHRGDLVLLRPAADYRVGDVAAYSSPELRRTVLHRIVARNGDRYLFKGDNNDFLDSTEPRSVPVSGKLWVRIPAAGGVLASVRQPGGAALAVGLLALLVLGAGGSSGRQRRMKTIRTAAAGSFERLPSVRLDRETAQTALLVCGGLAVVCLLVTLWAFRQPTAHIVTADDLYRHTGAFAYSAKAPKSPVYPRGSVRSGQTIFTRLVDTVAVRFDYRLDSAERRAVAGTSRLLIKLQGDNGWERTLTVQPWRAFSGDRARLRGILRPADLLALGRRVEAATGTITDSYALSLVPEIRLDGTLGEQPLEETFAPALAFRVNSTSMRLDTASPAGQDSTSLKRSEAGSGTRVEPRSVSFLAARFDIGTLRILALLGGLAALIGAGIARRALREPEGDEPAQIAAHYGAWVVDVVPRQRVPDSVLEVSSIEALARVAERFERMIVHEVRDGRHAYLVEVDGAVYRYQAREEGAQPVLRAVADEREAVTR